MPKRYSCPKIKWMASKSDSESVQYSLQKFLKYDSLLWLTNQPTNQLTKLMEQSPSWEANRSSTSNEIPRILWNPKVHYSIHMCPPPVSILIKTNSAHSLNPLLDDSLLFIYGWVFQVVYTPQISPTKTLYAPLPSPIRATCPAHLTLHFITRMLRIVIKHKISSNYDFKFVRPTICQRNQVDKHTVFERKLHTIFKKIRQRAESDVWMFC